MTTKTMVKIRFSSLVICLGVILNQLPQYLFSNSSIDQQGSSGRHSQVVNESPLEREGPFRQRRHGSQFRQENHVDEHREPLNLHIATITPLPRQKKRMVNLILNSTASSGISTNRHGNDSFGGSSENGSLTNQSSIDHERPNGTSFENGSLTNQSSIDRERPNGPSFGNKILPEKIIPRKMSPFPDVILVPRTHNHSIDDEPFEFHRPRRLSPSEVSKNNGSLIIGPFGFNQLDNPSVPSSNTDQCRSEQPQPQMRPDSSGTHSHDHSEGFSVMSLIRRMKKPFVQAHQFPLDSSSPCQYPGLTPNSETCSLNITQLPHFHPWLLDPRSHKILHPTSGENIVIANGGELLLVCSGDDNHFYGVDKTNVAIAKCVMGKFLYRDNTLVRNIDIRCHNIPTTILRKTTNKCHGNFAIYAVGFWIQKQVSFTTVFELCVNNRKKNLLKTKYASHEIQPAVQFSQQLLHFELSNLHEPVHSSPVLKEKIMKRHKSTHFHADVNMLFMHSYLARKENFVYRTEKLATFIIANSALKFISPENKKITQVMESDVRDLAVSQGPITVYTGTSGVLTLGDITQDQIADHQCPVKLQVHPNYKKRSTVPVPTIYWNVIHNYELTRSIALISHNQGIKHDCSKLCEDVSPNVPWLKGWKTLKSNASYASPNEYYACEVSDFLDRDQSLLPIIHHLDMSLL